MCGIIGILGRTDEQDQILDGLARLEYRGYGSAGGAIMSDAKVIGSPSRSSLDDFLIRSVRKRGRFVSAKEFGKVGNL